MRGLVVVVAGLLAHGRASADVVTAAFGAGHGLEGWKSDATGFEIAGSELHQHLPGRFSRALPLDARGWAVEARVAADDGGAIEIVVADDRLTTRFTRTSNQAMLDGEPFELVVPAGVHTYRIEAAGGRRLLLVDGQVVIDHDVGLPTMVLDPVPMVTFGAVALGARWRSVVVDTAPTGLAQSALPYQGALRFQGPFATWFFRYAGRATQIAAQLAQLQLPERARACVAFAIVAATATPRPPHYRKAELAKLPKKIPMEPVPPKFEFDLMESPRAARKPVMRPRRIAADIRAQAELVAALAATDPRPFYDRAVMITVNEAPLPQEALTWLMAQLPDLAQHPDACR